VNRALSSPLWLVVVPPLAFSLAIYPLVTRQRRSDALLAAVVTELYWRWTGPSGLRSVRDDLATAWAAVGSAAAVWCLPPVLRLVGVELGHLAIPLVGQGGVSWHGLALLDRPSDADGVAAALLVTGSASVFAVSAVTIRRWQFPPPHRLLSPRVVLLPLALVTFCWGVPVLLTLWLVIASALHAGRVAQLAGGGGRWDPAPGSPGSEQAEQLRSRLLRATPDSLAGDRRTIQRRLAWLLVLQPARGLELVELLGRRDPGWSAGPLEATALRAQVRAAPETLVRDWPSLERRFVDVLGQRPVELVGSLARSLRLVPPVGRSAWFRRRATRLLLGHLDATVRLSKRPPGWSAVAGRRGRRLLAAVQAGGTPLSTGQTWCLLGDLAMTDPVRLPEATARYRVAVREACPQAPDRLAHCLASEGRGQLRRGRHLAARRRLAAAHALREDPLYELLQTISWAAAPGRSTDDRLLLGRLERLRDQGVDGQLVAFWTAALHQLCGRPELAAAVVDEYGPARLHDPPTWAASDQLVALRAARQRDTPALSALGTALRDAGRPWLEHGPADPWPVLAAAARDDRQLLAEIVEGVRRPRDLPWWARLVGAHGAMERSLRLVDERSPLEAGEALDLADRLLRRRLL
jgi:hypothetical protein